jgi:hypothetical protein
MLKARGTKSVRVGFANGRIWPLLTQLIDINKTASESDAWLQAAEFYQW